MNDRLRESVSALVDGEASAMELRRVLANANSTDVRDRWRAYQLTRGALAGDSLQFAHIDLSVRVGEAIAGIDLDEVAPDTDSRGFAWRKSLGGVAVAATVAAVVVLAGQTLRLGDEQAVVADAAKGRVYPSSTLTGPAVNDGALSADFSGIAPASAIDPNREAERQLEKLLIQHTERAAANNGQGVISFARVPAVEEPVEDKQ